MKKRILLVDDLEDIRELVTFIIESSFDCEVFQESSGNKAIERLKNHGPVDLIITDFNMPDGTGLDIFRFLKQQNQQIPFALMSGGYLSDIPELRDETLVASIPKPFTDQDVLNTVNALLTSVEFADSTYVPVRLELLSQIDDLQLALFVKINDTKYIRVTTADQKIDAEFLAKYETKHVQHLYIESNQTEEFIREFKRKVLSDLAWSESSTTTDNPNSPTDHIKLNTELMRELTEKFGWSDEIVDLAQSHAQRTFRIARQSPDFKKAMSRFLTIEKFGFADYTSLLVLVSIKMASENGLTDEATQRKLTFASLFHDVSLSDEQFAKQKQLCQSIANSSGLLNGEQSDFKNHPFKASELCRTWQMCPEGVSEIILEHHENENGTGFPNRKTASEIGELSRLMIVAEDFVVYFFTSLGRPDLQTYHKLGAPKFQTPEFKKYFASLLKCLGDSDQIAS